jgi:serine phosphatase RsbU (regulator of sigma subunit)
MNITQRTPILLLLLLALLNGQLLSQEAIEIGEITSSVHFAEKAILIEDAEHFLNAEDIINENYSPKAVIKVKNHIPYLDFTRSTYWMILDIQNTQDIKHLYYLELARPLTNVVNLHIFDENNNKISSNLAGDEMAFKERPYEHKNFIFPIKIPANTKYRLVVETTSDGEILKLPMKFWEINSFTQFASKENFFLGLYYGLFILVVVFFSFFGIALKQNIYIHFVSYVFFLGLFQFSLDGLAYQYLWPTSPWLGNHAILILAAVSLLSMLLYVRKFLEFSNNHKIYNRIYSIFIGMAAVGLIFSFTSGNLYAITFPTLNALSFIVVFYFLFGIILKARDGKTTDLPIVAAFVFLCLGAILFILSNVNLIENEFLASNALKIGSGFEVTFLSIAMASRYRRTQIEKIAAQNEAFYALEEVNKLKNEQTEKLEKQVAERTKEISEKNDILSEQNNEIINSINYAKRLQDAILPSEKVLIQLFKDSMVLYKPKDIVSGDFYWVEEKDGKVYFAVADCTGHGVPGAMVSVLGNNSLNRCINEYGLTDAGKILDTLTELVETTLNKSKENVSDGMDIALCVWDKKETLQFAGANNSLYLIRNKELIETKPNKQPIGKYFKRVPFVTHNFKIEKGDSYYLFSDGYADQFGGLKGKKLKYSVFKNYLIELDNNNCQHIQNELDQRFEDWKGDLEQVDDVCILNVKF